MPPIGETFTTDVRFQDMFNNPKLTAQLAAAHEEVKRLRTQLLQRETGAGRDLDEARTVLRIVQQELERQRRQIDAADRQWQATIDGEPDLVFMYDKSYRIARANRAYVQRAGMPAEDIVGKLYWEVFPRQAGPLPDVPASKGNAATADTATVRLSSGEVLLSWSRPIHGERGEYLGTLHFLRDITSEKKVETAYKRNVMTLRMNSRCLLEIAQAPDEAQMLRMLCETLVDRHAYRLAWVGYAFKDRHDISGPVISYGRRSEHAAMHRPDAGSVVGEHSPAAIAIRTGVPFVAQNVLNDARFAFMRSDAAKCGYASMIALPLRNEGHVLAALCIYAVEPFAFEPEELALMEILSGAVSLRMAAWRRSAESSVAAREREHYLRLSRDLLEETIGSIVTAVESFKSDCAGHETRVADLAKAIAMEMGLPEEHLRGIHLAGIVHDIGNVFVPGEIINKTGKLSEEEWADLKSHCELGYGILKQIEFPWPVAETVLQHHERLDGSGYPQGLKGSAILMEARILAVADTVVSMAFEQRANRPRLGLPAALAEIEKNEGGRFDAAVVNAALKLFREKHRYSEAWRG